MSTEKKPKKPAKPKAPIVHAQKWIEKQIVAITESKLPAEVKVQVNDWLTGLSKALLGIENVVNPAVPPAANTIHGQLIAYGKSQRDLQQVLAAVGAVGISDEGDDEDEDEPAQGAAPGQQAAMAGRAAAAAAGI